MKIKGIGSIGVHAHHKHITCTQEPDAQELSIEFCFHFGLSIRATSYPSPSSSDTEAITGEALTESTIKSLKWRPM